MQEKAKKKLHLNIVPLTVYISRGESEKGLSVYISKEALTPFSLSPLDLKYIKSYI